MAKWFVEYSILESSSEGWTERDGDRFFHLPVQRLTLDNIEDMLVSISLSEGANFEDITIENIAKINTN